MDIEELLDKYLEKNGYKHAPIKNFEKREQGITVFVAENDGTFNIIIPDIVKNGIFISFEALLDFSIKEIDILEDRISNIYEKIGQI